MILPGISSRGKLNYGLIKAGDELVQFVIVLYCIVIKDYFIQFSEEKHSGLATLLHAKAEPTRSFCDPGGKLEK